MPVTGTAFGPARLERHAHQRLRPLVAEHPSPIHPRVCLVIDAGAPHRLVSGGDRARHEQIPTRPRRIAVHLDLAVQAVMDREREDPRCAPEETRIASRPSNRPRPGLSQSASSVNKPAIPRRRTGRRTRRHSALSDCGSPPRLPGPAAAAPSVRAVPDQIGFLRHISPTCFAPPRIAVAAENWIKAR